MKTTEKSTIRDLIENGFSIQKIPASYNYKLQQINKIISELDTISEEEKRCLSIGEPKNGYFLRGLKRIQIFLLKNSFFDKIKVRAGKALGRNSYLRVCSLVRKQKEVSQIFLSFVKREVLEMRTYLNIDKYKHIRKSEENGFIFKSVKYAERNVLKSICSEKTSEDSLSYIPCTEEQLEVGFININTGKWDTVTLKECEVLIVAGIQLQILSEGKIKALRYKVMDNYQSISFVFTNLPRVKKNKDTFAFFYDGMNYHLDNSVLISLTS